MQGEHVHHAHHHHHHAAVDHLHHGPNDLPQQPEHHLEHIHNVEQPPLEDRSSDHLHDHDDVHFHDQGAVGGSPSHDAVVNQGHASHEPSTSGLPCPSFELSWQSFNISGVNFSSPAFRNFQDYKIGQSESQHEFSPKMRATVRKSSARNNSVINMDFTGKFYRDLAY